MFTLNKPIIFSVNLPDRFCLLLLMKKTKDQKGYLVCPTSQSKSKRKLKSKGTKSLSCYINCRRTYLTVFTMFREMLLSMDDKLLPTHRLNIQLNFSSSSIWSFNMTYFCFCHFFFKFQQTLGLLDLVQHFKSQKFHWRIFCLTLLLLSCNVSLRCIFKILIKSDNYYLYDINILYVMRNEIQWI